MFWLKPAAAFATWRASGTENKIRRHLRCQTYTQLSPPSPTLAAFIRKTRTNADLVLYVADTNNHRVRQISGDVATGAGTVTCHAGRCSATVFLLGQMVAGKRRPGLHFSHFCTAGLICEGRTSLSICYCRSLSSKTERHRLFATKPAKTARGLECRTGLSW